MQTSNNWYEGIKKQLELFRESLNEKDYKKYKLRLLLCVAERVAEFSHQCGQCQIFQQDISTLTEDISNLVQVADKDKGKAHLKKINSIVTHLQKHHKLVTEGYYLGMWIGIGVALGLPLGIPLGNIALGMPIGMCIGVAIGASQDAKAKKENRVLCPREITGGSRTKLVLAVIVGALALAALVAYFLIRRFS